MRLTILVLSLFYSLCVKAQSENLYKFKIDKEDSLHELSKELATRKIHLIGGASDRSENLKIRNTYLHLLNQNNIYPKYILCEEGESVCYFRNLYFETGDSTFLHYIEMDESNRIFYKNMREYYIGLPKEQRFTFQSSDKESNLILLHFAIGYLLAEHQEEYKKDPALMTNYDLQIILRVIVDKEDPTMWAGKFLKEDVENVSTILKSRDSSILKNSFGSGDFTSLKKIIAGYHLAKKGKDRLVYEWESETYKQEREVFLSKNIYNLFVKDTSAYFVGLFAMTHVKMDLTEKIKGTSLNYSMAKMLNVDSLYKKTHGKIYSNIVYYRDLEKDYLFLYDKKKEVDPVFKKLPKGTISVQNYGKTISNTVILFKED